jgi:hypothetical protein
VCLLFLSRSPSFCRGTNVSEQRQHNKDSRGWSVSVLIEKQTSLVSLVGKGHSRIQDQMPMVLLAEQVLEPLASFSQQQQGEAQ